MYLFDDVALPILNEVVLITRSVASVDISGIFDNEFIEVDAGGTVGVAIQQPRFLCRTSDVSSATEGDAITILGVAYTIRIVQDDGTGMTTLVLEKN